MMAEIINLRQVRKAKARTAEHYRLAGIKSGKARRKKRDEKLDK